MMEKEEGRGKSGRKKESGWEVVEIRRKKKKEIERNRKKEIECEEFLIFRETQKKKQGGEKQEKKIDLPLYLSQKI